MDKLQILATLEAMRSSYAEVRTMRNLFIAYIEPTLSKKERAIWDARTRASPQPELRPQPPQPDATTIRAQPLMPAPFRRLTVHKNPGLPRRRLSG